ncbi:hypothetical protein Adt_46456 [Abeliophyllum distichum]|uniref:Uncharacterized protein n=1 Tax=Abeliophyllum distichum TaxID=126358 RepID=A0ABD1P028_9LAMI
MEDNVNVEEALLEEVDEGPAHVRATTFDEEEIIPPECNLSDSDNEVDDDGFVYETNAPELCCGLGRMMMREHRPDARRKVVNSRFWASLNKTKGCIQIKSKNSKHTCTRDRTNRHCTDMYIAKRYLKTFKVESGWKTSLIKKVVNDDVKLTINNVTA